MTEDLTSTVVRQWGEFAPGAVLLDGFHALKHALRFGAEVGPAVTSDKAAVLRLAGELAGDLTETLDGLLVEVDARTLRELVPRVHPTGVAALAVRRERRGNLEVLARAGRQAPVVVLDNPRNLGNIGAVVRLAAGFGATGVVTTGDIDPWHSNAVRAGAGLHFATAVERLSADELPGGPLFALDPAGEDIRALTIPDDALLAFGSERHGISPELKAKADRLVALPMQPQVSSYNLATSVAMTLFHWSAWRTAGVCGDDAGMTLTSMCLCLVTRTTAEGEQEVLLGRKKRGFGAGNIVGLGGHVEAGETPVRAAVRELAEESSLVVDEAELRQAARLVFRFPARPAYDQEVAVFVTDKAVGTARESEEIAPSWYPVRSLPLEVMWDDAKYWMAAVLGGAHVQAEFTFADDCLTVAQARIERESAMPG